VNLSSPLGVEVIADADDVLELTVKHYVPGGAIAEKAMGTAEPGVGSLWDGKKDLERLVDGHEVRDALHRIRRHRPTVLLPFEIGGASWRPKQGDLLVRAQ